MYVRNDFACGSSSSRHKTDSGPSAVGLCREKLVCDGSWRCYLLRLHHTAAVQVLHSLQVCLKRLPQWAEDPFSYFTHQHFSTIYQMVIGSYCDANILVKCRQSFWLEPSCSMCTKWFLKADKINKCENNSCPLVRNMRQIAFIVTLLTTSKTKRSWVILYLSVQAVVDRAWDASSWSRGWGHRQGEREGHKWQSPIRHPHHDRSEQGITSVQAYKSKTETIFILLYLFNALVAEWKQIFAFSWYKDSCL